MANMPFSAVTLKQLLEARPWLTERFVRRLVAERRVPFSKVGERLLFDVADFDELVEAGRVEVKSEARGVAVNPRRLGGDQR
jgi:excisionase family DNA binding protein